jgi:hypothetical protein
MSTLALISSIRLRVNSLRAASVLFLHTARGFDIFVGGHQTLLDAIVLIRAIESGDSVLALIVLGRISLELVGTIHAVTTLGRDHRKWWRDIGTYVPGGEAEE